MWWNSYGDILKDIDKKSKKAEGFDKNQKEIERVTQYLKEKREAFYKNNNIKER